MNVPRDLRVRISDDLFVAIRSHVPNGQSVNSFVREAVAEKLGRSQLRHDVEELQERVRAVERILASR